MFGVATTMANEENTPLEFMCGKELGLEGGGCLDSRVNTGRYTSKKKTKFTMGLTMTHQFGCGKSPMFLLMKGGMMRGVCECMALSEGMWSGQIDTNAHFELEP